MSKKQQMFRRVLTFVLAAILALGFLSTVAFTVGADNGNINFEDLVAAARRGKCGENAAWSVDRSGVLSITGAGPMEINGDAPWAKYADEITTVTVEAGITSIDASAFLCCTKATAIVVGDDNTRYSTDASGVLYNKDQTELIMAPGGITGDYVIPVAVIAIGENAFRNCTALANVYYTGTKAQWNAIKIDNGNDILANVQLKSVKITTQPKGATVLVGKTASISVKATGEGLKYAWYYAKKGSSNFAKISGSSATYSAKMTDAMDGGQYYCVITDKYGTSVKSSVVTLKKANTAKITTQPKNTVAEKGKTAKVTIKASGDGLTYTWYYAKKGSSKFTKVSGSSATYSVKMSSSVNGRKVYCVVTDKYGTSVKSSTVTLSQGKLAKITTQPTGVTVKVGKTAKITIKASGDGVKYTWYYKNAGASKFTKVSGSKNSYSAKMTEAMDGRQVYCVVTDKYGNSVKSSVVTIKKVNTAKITTQPKSIAVENGKTAKVTIKATGDGLKYTWYYAKKGSSKYKKVSGNKDSYSVKMSSSVDGGKVYCVVKDKHGTSVKSSVATLTMRNYAKITTQPQNVTVVVGKTASISVKATGDGLKYTWYHKDAGAAKYSKASITKDTYSAKMTEAMDGRSVYCVVTDKYGNTVKSSVVTIKKANTAKITTQPKNATAPKGSTAKVTIKASGDGLTYTWYYAKKGSSKFTKVSGSSATYSVKMSSSVDGRKVYCVVKDKYGTSVKSSVVTLYMGNPVKITTQPKNVAVDEGATAKVTVKATGDGLKYQWYYKNAGASSFKKYAAGTTATYSTKMSSGADGRQVYCVVTDKYGNTAKSSVATLTMEVAIDIDFTEGSWEYTGLFAEAEYDIFDFTFYNESEGLVSVSYWSVLSQEEIEEYLDWGWSMEDFREIEGNYCVNFHGTWREFTYTVKGNTVTISVEYGEDGENDGNLVLKAQKDKSLKIVSQKNFVSDAALEVGKSLTWVEPIPEPVEMDFIKKPLENVVGNYGDTLTVTLETEGEDLTYMWWEYDEPKPGEEDTGENTLSDQDGPTYTMVLTPENAGREIFCVVYDKDGNYDSSNGIYLDLDMTQGHWEYDTGYGVCTAKFTGNGNSGVLSFAGMTTDFTVTSRFGRTFVLSDGTGTVTLKRQDDRSMVITAVDQSLTYSAFLKVGDSWTWVDSTPKIVELDLSSGHWSCETEPRNGTLNQYYMVASNENQAYLLVYAYTTDASKDADINEPIVIDGVTYYNYGAAEYRMNFVRSGNTFTMTGAETDASLVVTLQEDYSMVLESVSGVLNSEIMKTGDVFTFEAYPVYVDYIRKHPENTFGDYGDVLTATVEAEGEGLSYLWYVWNGEDWVATNQTTPTYTMTMSEATAGQVVCCRVTDAEGNSQDSCDATFDYIAPGAWGTFRYFKPTADKSHLVVAGLNVEGKMMDIQLWEPLAAGEEPQEGKDLAADGIYYREPGEGWWRPVELSVEEGLVKIAILEAEKEVAAIYLERTDFCSMRVVRTTGTINDIPGFVENIAEGDAFNWN